VTGSNTHPAARTALLMAVLVTLLGIGGWAFGGRGGLVLFSAFGLILNFGTYWFSDRLALMAHRARPISRSREEIPGLYEIVERVAHEANIRANISTIRRLPA